MPHAPPARKRVPPHVQELVKGVLGVLPRERQDAAVPLLLQRRHLCPDVVVRQGRALRGGGGLGGEG